MTKPSRVESTLGWGAILLFFLIPWIWVFLSEKVGVILFTNALVAFGIAMLMSQARREGETSK